MKYRITSPACIDRIPQELRERFFREAVAALIPKHIEGITFDDEAGQYKKTETA